METCFLDRIPPALQRLPITSLDFSAERVIAEVTGNGVEQASVPDLADPMSDRPVELRPGSVHFIPYPSIADLLEAERVRLLWCPVVFIALLVFRLMKLANNFIQANLHLLVATSLGKGDAELWASALLFYAPKL